MDNIIYHKMSLKQISDKHSLINIEEQVLDKWTKENTFLESMKRTKERKYPLYSFYDGPPFATGSPHYGHILAGTIKDVMGRRKTMEGYHVERRAGWDCLAGETLVYLADGTSLPIEEMLNNKKKIVSYNEHRKCIITTEMTQFFDQGEKECIELSFGNGKQLVCTHDHKIMTEKGYMKADDIIIGETSVITYDHTTKLLSKKGVGIKKVYDICVPETSSFIANGIVVHNCHGVPIEMMIQKKLGISSKKDIEEYGIPKFNEECRKVVMCCADEWKSTIGRLGRWIDFDNDYKTLDTNYMESVWWVFSELYKKGLIYRGYKVMPYSCAMTTCLSNFEAGLNYKETIDPSIVVKFPLKNNVTRNLLAWTTTPWTLPSNLALCTSENMSLVEVHLFDDDKKEMDMTKTYIASERFFKTFFDKSKKKKKKEKEKMVKYEIVNRLTGKDIEGLEYVPLYPFFVGNVANGAFTVLLDDYVKDDTGTGVVHQAPAFGEDDNRVCKEKELVAKDGTGMPCPVDDDGCFDLEGEVELNGKFVKDCDKLIIKKIKSMDRLFDCAWETHNYPFCWRTDTPLIYKAVPSWYVNVEKIKDKLLENNKKTRWVPQHVQEKRFHNWLEDARDWAVSRSRYWGTPLPIWANEDFSEVVVIGSVEELEKRSGTKVTDLHREYVDHITIPGKNGDILKRVPSVFDCWLESGCMPYGQAHYPFENKEEFEKSFPADFICEGLDQTRGWFYTLMVLSTALFDKPAFKNVIVNGMLLTKGESPDGKPIVEKMSKSKNNYTDPLDIVKIYGADALRLYLLGSPAVKANSLVFDDAGVHGIVKDILLPLTNSYKFFVESYTIYTSDNKLEEKNELEKIDNILDRWILSLAQTLIDDIAQDIEMYHVDTIVRRLINFIDKLNNIYIRFNRRRLKGMTNGEESASKSLSVLFKVLYNIVLLMAPFAPFNSEFFYSGLKTLLPEDEQLDSVHFCLVPNLHVEKDKDLEKNAQDMIDVINLVRIIRNKKVLSQKIPLKQIIVCPKDKQTRDNILSLKKYILDESNVLDMIVDEQRKYVQYDIKPVMQNLGKKYKKNVKHILQLLKTISQKEIEAFKKDNKLQLGEYTLDNEDLQLTPKIITADEYEYALENDILLMANVVQNEEILELYNIRTLGSMIQQLRKKAGLHPWDKIKIFYESNDKFNKIIKKHIEILKEKVIYDLYPASMDKEKENLADNLVSIDNNDVTISFKLI